MSKLFTKNDFDYLRKRGVKSLIHFTPVDNLDKILQEGLKPSRYIDNQKFVNNRTKRGINKDFVSLSIEYPNYMYLNSLIEKYNIEMVILVVSLCVLIDREIEIHKSNPALPRWGKAYTIGDLFFDDYRFKDLPLRYPTDPRAEVRVKGNISSSSIQKIYFQSSNNEKFDQYRYRYKNIIIKENKEIFLPRLDSFHWKEIRMKGLDSFVFGS